MGFGRHLGEALEEPWEESFVFIAHPAASATRSLKVRSARPERRTIFSTSQPAVSPGSRLATRCQRPARYEPNAMPAKDWGMV
jgi:hypothetical protein